VYPVVCRQNFTSEVRSLISLPKFRYRKDLRVFKDVLFTYKRKTKKSYYIHILVLSTNMAQAVTCKTVYKIKWN